MKCLEIIWCEEVIETQNIICISVHSRDKVLTHATRPVHIFIIQYTDDISKWVKQMEVHQHISVTVADVYT